MAGTWKVLARPQPPLPPLFRAQHSLFLVPLPDGLLLYALLLPGSVSLSLSSQPLLDSLGFPPVCSVKRSSAQASPSKIPVAPPPPDHSKPAQMPTWAHTGFHWSLSFERWGRVQCVNTYGTLVANPHRFARALGTLVSEHAFPCLLWMQKDRDYRLSLFSEPPQDT